MVSTIDRDHSRFKDIVRGKVKKELRKFMSNGELVGRKGKDLVSIPLPQIELPRFQFGDKSQGGIGQGEGKEGDPAGPGDGEGEAGDQPGEHTLEVELTIDELAEIMGEELELPRIEPKGQQELEQNRYKYTSISRRGPGSLVHFKKSYKQALKRLLSTGEYNAENPMIFPIKEDIRYRSWKRISEPHSNAVIIYMMDVSGSMQEEQKEIVRMESFWIDLWIQKHYKGLETRYIIHDATAKEVDKETFFRTKESGGTVISSAYDLCRQIVEKDYPLEYWNIYPFHFSDGDNWSEGDNRKCIDLLNEHLLKFSNMFCYGQVKSQYGSGKFIEELEKAFPEDERVVLSEIEDKDSIMDSIKEFLGKGN